MGRSQDGKKPSTLFIPVRELMKHRHNHKPTTTTTAAWRILSMLLLAALLVRQASAAGYTVYSFCSERGAWPCTPAQAPLLTVWYH